MVVDALIVRLAAEPAVRAMNLLDNLADQLTRRNAAPAQDRAATPPALGGRVAAASRGNRSRTLELLALRKSVSRTRHSQGGVEPAALGVVNDVAHHHPPLPCRALAGPEAGLEAGLDAKSASYTPVTRVEHRRPTVRRSSAIGGTHGPGARAV